MKTTILLVEDEEENALLAVTLIKKLGVDVMVAQNGKEALRLASEKQPALVLLDIVMPGMSGLEVLEKLRADPKTKDLAVIMLTSRREVADFNRSKELGAKGFLNKPYDNDAFLSRLCIELGVPMPTRAQG